MVQPHYLKHNLNTSCPAAHIVCDVQLAPLDPNAGRVKQERPLALWSARAFRYYRGDVSRVAQMQSDSPAAWWTFLSKRLDYTRPLWVWLYQAGRAVTSLKLWDEMDSERVQLDEPYWRYQKRLARNPRALRRKGFIADADPPTILSLWSSGGQQFKIVDVLNWYRESMKQLAERTGVQSEDLDASSFAPATARQLGQNRLLVLCRTVTGLLDAVHQHDMGILQPTAAGQAMSCFRHRFLDTQIVVRDDPEVRQCERACYYGGRVETFFLGLVRRTDAHCPLNAPAAHEGGVLGTPGPIYHLDVSAMYPSIMRLKDLPVALQCAPEFNVHPHRPQAHAVRRWCAEVTVQSDTIAYPRREQDQTVWATGHFRTFLCGPELLRCWLNGHIAAFHYVCAYNLQVSFKRYVDYWWAIRQRAAQGDDPHTEQLAKIMLNSLYGKFAQRIRPWVTCLGKRPRQRWGSYAERCHEDHPYQVYRGLAGVLQVRTETEDYRHGFPAIAAFICAEGRCLMDDLRRVAGEREVYYQCVDGLYTSERGYKRLVAAGEVMDNELGRLRLVAKADYLRIWGPNDYQFGDRVVRAGLSFAPGQLSEDKVAQERSYALPYYLGRGPGAGVIGWKELAGRQVNPPRGVLGADGWITPFKRVEVEQCPVPF